jgi:hypothetical protein
VSAPSHGPIGRLARAFIVVMAAVLVAVAVSLAVQLLRDRGETARTTPEFDPPVWAGQNVPVPCATGGFYARDQQAVVITIAAHCFVALPGSTWHDLDGRLIGTFGPAMEEPDCPTGRYCAAADFIALELAPDRIPWGHLNLVDMGAGGYRTIEPGTRPLSCADVHQGDGVELNGREHFRSGSVLEVGPYEHATDTIFPCIVVTDIEGGPGDSGAAVLVDGLPAGTTSRVIGRYLAFTPLEEGLESLELVLCTTPDCDLARPGTE